MDTYILNNIQFYGFQWYRRGAVLGIALCMSLVIGGWWLVADGIKDNSLIPFLWGGMLVFLGAGMGGEFTFILDRLYRGWKIYGFLHGEYAAHKNDAGWLHDTLGVMQAKIEKNGFGVELYGKYHTLLCRRLRVLEKRPWQLSVIPYRNILVRLIRKEIFLSLWLLYTLVGLYIAIKMEYIPYIPICLVAVVIYMVQTIITIRKIKDCLCKISGLELCNEMDAHADDIKWLGERKEVLSSQIGKTVKEREKDLCRKGVEYIDFIMKEREERLQQQGGGR